MDFDFGGIGMPEIMLGIVIAAIVLLFVVFFRYVPIGLWSRARASGVRATWASKRWWMHVSVARGARVSFHSTSTWRRSAFESRGSSETRCSGRATAASSSRA